MSITFWILIILMLLLAIALLAYPVLKQRKISSIAYRESNLSINHGKLEELELDLAEGRIDQPSYEAAQEELKRELLIDIPSDDGEVENKVADGIVKKQPALILILAIFVPAMSIMIYFQLGMPSATDAAFVASQQQPQQPASIEDLTKQLQARIERDGGTAQDWVMLARAHKHMGEYVQAEKAFVVARQHDRNNVALMLELAEMMAVNNNRMFDAQSRELVLKAYALEPENINALWFVGVAEYQANNYRPAIDHLLALLPVVRDDEEMIQSIIAMISRSRLELIAAGEDMPELETILGMTTTADAGLGMTSEAVSIAEAETTDQPELVASTAMKSLNVTVNISDEVRNKFNANDAVFVYAKAKQGSGMPLAAQRITLAELPATVVLDDSMAMVEGMNISAFEQLVISARVTKSGTALAQSGDYIGRNEYLNNKTNNKTNSTINIIIDTVVP